MINPDDYQLVQTKALPYSPANEEALLGSLLISPEHISKIDLDPEEFYLAKNQWIYQALQELFATGKNIDVTTVCTKLDERKHLGEIGGPAYLSRLMSSVPSTLHAETYAENVRDKARRRKALEIAGQIAGAAMDETRPLIDATVAGIDNLSRLTRSTAGAVHISQFVSKLYDEIETAYKNPQEVFGIPTGTLDFDAITGGLQRGEVLKLTGDPGIGKSLLAYQWACGMAAHAPGVVYELEMSAMAVLRRRVSAVSKISTRAIRQGKIGDDEWGTLVGAIEAMSALPIYMSDSSAWTTAALRVDLERLIGLYGIQWVLIDYEGLLHDNPDDDDIARSKVISSRLHGIIKDLNLAGLVIDDMNKAGIDNGKAGKANLSGSARKIYDADQIVFMRSDDKDPQMVLLTWGKNREGETNRVVKLRRTPGFPCFQDVANVRDFEMPAYTQN